MKLWVTWLRKKCFQGHLTQNWGVFGVIWGQNSNIFKPRQLIYQNQALGDVITKKLFSRSFDPKLGGIWGHLGS